jgi:hypothetical protein
MVITELMFVLLFEVTVRRTPFECPRCNIEATLVGLNGKGPAV